MSRRGAKRSDTDPDPKWSVDIDVYVDDENVQPPFWLETCLPVNSSDEIVFHNRGRHGFTINFILHDQTQNGYLFPTSKKDAMWSTPGAGCPPLDSGQWKEFTVQDVSKDRLTLTARNLNETPTQFGFTLRVQDKNGAFRNLDPGGDNQNGFFLSFY
jgi:hypothetical protein